MTLPWGSHDSETETLVSGEAPRGGISFSAASLSPSFSASGGRLPLKVPPPFTFTVSLAGLHTWQWMYGCEVGPDRGFIGGSNQWAYDGEDFIAFDKDTLSWTARVPQALPTKSRWDDRIYTEARKNYLENICVGWLQRYLGYGQKTLQRTGEFEGGGTVVWALYLAKDPLQGCPATTKGHSPPPTCICDLHRGTTWHPPWWVLKVLPDSSFIPWLEIIICMYNKIYSI